jgi:hypothetical protein
MAHDLADPWDDSCADGAHCCVDTGGLPDPSCNAAHRDYLLQTGDFPGVTEPVTPSAGTTIHPRVKRQVVHIRKSDEMRTAPFARSPACLITIALSLRQIGARLATAAWNVGYGHDDTAFVGPVLAGCAIETRADGTRALRVSFDSHLLKGDTVALSEYNRSEHASVTWVLIDTPPPDDAERNFLYANRQPWWGDSSSWVNVDLSLDGALCRPEPEHLP